ncbi:MAG: MarR family transcriptional regulator [Agarilytica sp.]
MFERCVYFNANTLARKLSARWEESFKKYGLSPAHGYLIRLILEEPGVSQQYIGETLVLDKSTVTRFINKLEKSGWVSREPSEKDQREKIINPTDKAQQIHQDLRSLGDELYSSMKQLLGKDELEVFVKTLRAFSLKL